jgi:hypothetical protein
MHMTRGLKIRSIVQTSLFVLMLTAVAAPAAAQVVHSISFGAGLFVPRAEASRATGDVLVADLNQPVIPGTVPPITASLAFQISDFKSIPVFAEWHIGFNDHVEVAIGGGFTNQSVPSVYRDMVNGHDTDTTSDDTEIQQTLKLQTIPITGLVRFLGGRPGHVQPYGGGGIIVSFFNYSESGDFVDTRDFTVFNAKYVAKDVAFGPVILGGVRLPVGGDIYALNFEARYHWIVGDTGGNAAGFLGDKIDLGGWSLLGSFLVRF